MGSFWATLRMRIGRLRVRWRRFADTRRGKQVIWVARQTITLAVAGYLLYQMSLIGWGEIWNALPTTPWFYAVFLLIYFALPLFHTLAFGVIWTDRSGRLFPAMLKKRVYDKDVLSRSGDVYAYFWARTNVHHTDRELLHHVKDNAIVSSVASTFLAVGLLGIFLAAGYIPLPEFIARHEVTYGIVAAAAIAVLVGVGIRFRQWVFLLPVRVLGLLFGIHFVRELVLKGLRVVEWDVALPEISLGIWVTFLAVQIITSRIPLLPGRELIFMAAGIELAGAVQVSQAAIAGLLGVHSVLDKVLNLCVFLGVSAWEREVVERVTDVIGVGAPPDVAREGEPETPVVESSPESSPTS